jgi:hypothetical protein
MLAAVIAAFFYQRVNLVMLSSAEETEGAEAATPVGGRQ